MNVAWALVSALLLQPVLHDDATVRLAASNTAGEDVVWYMDEQVLAVVPSGGHSVVGLPAGQHDVWATTAYDGDWRVIVRPVYGDGKGDVMYVQGWSANYQAAETNSVPWVPALLIGGGLATVWLGRSRPKRP